MPRIGANTNYRGVATRKDLDGAKSKKSVEQKKRLSYAQSKGKRSLRSDLAKAYANKKRSSSWQTDVQSVSTFSPQAGVEGMVGTAASRVANRNAEPNIPPLKTINWPQQNSRSHPKWGPVLTDVARHLPSKFGTYFDDRNRMTHAHEASHGIHSHLRNHEKPGNERVNGFYLLNGKATFVKEPNMGKREVGRFVPENLRGSRYKTYVEKSPGWEDRPTYIFDEWNSYINGAAAGVDLNQRNMWNQSWQDGMMGPLEFNVYSLATGMAVKNRLPEYWNGDDGAQMKAFLKHNLKRSMDIYNNGSKMDAYKWDKQDAYLDRLQTSPEAQKMRDFVTDTFGSQFAKEVLGF